MNDSDADTDDVVALIYQHSFELGALHLDLRASGDSSLGLSFNHDDEPRIGISKRLWLYPGPVTLAGVN